MQATCAQLQQKERLEQELSVSKDDSYVYVLDRLNILSHEDFDGLELRWHKTCYSNFSSESKLQRLKCNAKHQPASHLRPAHALRLHLGDVVMSIKLSGVCDLIAAEGCYNLTCLITFERRCMKAKSSMVSLDNETNECMTELCRELSTGLSRGHVYDMFDVWKKIREHGERNWYDYTKEIPVKKDMILRSSSTVDWIKGKSRKPAHF